MEISTKGNNRNVVTEAPMPKEGAHTSDHEARPGRHRIGADSLTVAHLVARYGQAGVRS